MGKFLPAFRRGHALIRNVTLTASVLPQEVSVVVDGMEKYRGRSLAKASQVCARYRAKMDAQIKAEA